MRIIDARNPDEEFIVAEAECECGDAIQQWCTPIKHEGEEYPPVYTWKHLDGTVLCERPRIATPKQEN